MTDSEATAKRSLRKRASAIKYTERDDALDKMLGVSPRGGGKGRANIDIAGMRQKLERTCPAAPFAAFVKRPAAVLETLKARGFRRPLVVKSTAAGSVTATRAALGLRLPLDALSPRGLVQAVGADHIVHTFCVESQDSGPKMTVQQLVDYFERPPEKRQRLINVVSFSLADTPLAERIQVPAAVRALDLATTLWPEEEKPGPETLLYMLLGPQGAYTDWHEDMGGSSVWYHVIKGCKVFMLAPNSQANMRAFEMWSASERQTAVFLGDRLEGCERVTLREGDTLFLPSGWPHAVSTPKDSVVIGGNYLHPLDLGSIADVYDCERRLGVTPKFQYPLFMRLLYYTAVDARKRMAKAQQTLRRLAAAQHAQQEGKVTLQQRLEAARMTQWEADGLPQLVRLLRENARGDSGSSSARNKQRQEQDIPAEIYDPEAFLDGVERALRQLLRPGYVAGRDDGNGSIEGLSQLHGGSSGEEEGGSSSEEDGSESAEVLGRGGGARRAAHARRRSGKPNKPSGSDTSDEGVVLVHSVQHHRQQQQFGQQRQQQQQHFPPAAAAAAAPLAFDFSLAIALAAAEHKAVGAPQNAPFAAGPSGGGIGEVRFVAVGERRLERRSRDPRLTAQRAKQMATLEQLKKATAARQDGAGAAAAAATERPPSAAAEEQLQHPDAAAVPAPPPGDSFSEPSSSDSEGDSDSGCERENVKQRSQRPAAKPAAAAAKSTAAAAALKKPAGVVKMVAKPNPPARKPQTSAPAFKIPKKAAENQATTRQPAPDGAMPLGSSVAGPRRPIQPSQPSSPLFRTAPSNPTTARAAALKQLAELRLLQEAIAREESLLEKVASGQVQLKDGGAKLTAKLEDRRKQLKGKTQAAEGKVFTFVGLDGRKDGPYTAQELRDMVASGAVPRGCALKHRDGRLMSLEEAQAVEEPLTAKILREKRREAGRKLSAPAGSPRASAPVKKEEPRRIVAASAGVAPKNSFGRGRDVRVSVLASAGGGGSSGGGGGGASQNGAGGTSGVRQRERERVGEEFQLQVKRQRPWEPRAAPPAAAPQPSIYEIAAQAAAPVSQAEALVIWTFQNPKTEEMDGPFSTAELREIHRKGELSGSLMVHDEGGGVSTPLMALLGGSRGAPAAPSPASPLNDPAAHRPEPAAAAPPPAASEMAKKHTLPPVPMISQSVREEHAYALPSPSSPLQPMQSLSPLPRQVQQEQPEMLAPLPPPDHPPPPDLVAAARAAMGPPPGWQHYLQQPQSPPKAAPPLIPDFVPLQSPQAPVQYQTLQPPPQQQQQHPQQYAYTPTATAVGQSWQRPDQLPQYWQQQQAWLQQPQQHQEQQARYETQHPWPQHHQHQQQQQPVAVAVAAPYGYQSSPQQHGPPVYQHQPQPPPQYIYAQQPAPGDTLYTNYGVSHQEGEYITAPQPQPQSQGHPGAYLQQQQYQHQQYHQP